MQPTKFVPMKTPLSQAILDNWSLDAAPKFRLSVSDLLEQESSKGRHVGLIIGGQAAVATQRMQSCHMARALSPQLALACTTTPGYVSTVSGPSSWLSQGTSGCFICNGASCNCWCLQACQALQRCMGAVCMAAAHISPC